MSADHFSSISVRNYRGFRSLDIKNLTRINLVGGVNGVGKSTFLEAAFNLADRTNGMALFRPYQWRQIPLGPSDNLDAVRQAYFARDTSQNIAISGDAPSGKVSVEYEFGPQIIEQVGATQVSQQKITEAASETVATSIDGYRAIATKHSVVNFEAKVQLSPSGAIIFITNNNTSQIKTATILNNLTKHASDNGNRFTSLVKKDKINSLKEFLHLVHSEVSDLMLLNIANNAIIHANVGKNTWVPLPFLGEGAASLVTAMLAICDSEEGNVFLDEVDASVHHSQLRSMWKLIVRAAKTFDVQIFATTHSEESLEAFAQAVDEEKAYDDISYHRLRYDKQRNHQVISYTGKKLIEAVNQDWEVR